MKALLHSLLEAATLGRPVVLCTVVHSGGSAPRSAGAHMAVFADGSTRGTVGGGRLELLTAKEGLSLLQRQTSALRPMTSRSARAASAWPAAAMSSCRISISARSRPTSCAPWRLRSTPRRLLAEARHCRGRQNGRFAFERGGPFPVRGPAGLDAGNAQRLHRAAHAAGARLPLRCGACRAGARAGAGICRLCRDGL